MPDGAHAGADALREYVTATFPRDIACRALVFAHTLREAQDKALLKLLMAVDGWAVAGAVEAESRTWEHIRAYLPGLARSVDAIRGHAQDGGAVCAAVESSAGAAD